MSSTASIIWSLARQAVLIDIRAVDDRKVGGHRQRRLLIRRVPLVPNQSGIVLWPPVPDGSASSASTFVWSAVTNLHVESSDPPLSSQLRQWPLRDPQRRRGSGTPTAELTTEGCCRGSTRIGNRESRPRRGFIDLDVATLLAAHCGAASDVLQSLGPVEPAVSPKTYVADAALVRLAPHP
jgi:hypothetical protein